MAVPTGEHQSSEHIDRGTWRRLSEAIRRLAMVDAVSLQLGDYAEGAAPARRILGKMSERGELDTGKARFIWFRDQAEPFLQQLGHEGLRAQVDFSMETSIGSSEETESSFYGTLQFYPYSSGVAEGKIVAAGRTVTKNPDAAYPFAAFASRLGLSRLWTDIYEHAGETERTFDGSLTQGETMRIAGALVDLDLDSIGPRP